MKTVYTTEMCGDKFEIAADFAQASCPVSGDHCGRQVADFQHNPRQAMRAQLSYYMLMSGEIFDLDDISWEDDSIDGKIESALNKMVGRNEDLIEMAEMLEKHGDRFTGNAVDDEAQEWLNRSFDATSADGWCKIGVWDAATAAEFRNADLLPAQVKSAAESMIEDLEDATKTYTDGDPIYSTCNGDTNVVEIIEAAFAISAEA